MDPTTDPNILPSQIFTTVAALLPAIDRRIVVVLRDGRKLFGVLRSFDQFGMFDCYLFILTQILSIRSSNIHIYGSVIFQKPILLSKTLWKEFILINLHLEKNIEGCSLSEVKM